MRSSWCFSTLERRLTLYGCNADEYFVIDSITIRRLEKNPCIWLTYYATEIPKSKLKLAIEAGIWLDVPLLKGVPLGIPVESISNVTHIALPPLALLDDEELIELDDKLLELEELEEDDME